LEQALNAFDQIRASPEFLEIERQREIMRINEAPCATRGIRSARNGRAWLPARTLKSPARTSKSPARMRKTNVSARNSRNYGPG